jgi:hypothetical protein
MGQIRRLAGFGVVVTCMLLSASDVVAQHNRVSDLKKQEQANPSTTVVYVFCKSWRGSIQRNTIYYSGVFATDLRDRSLAQQAFLQFIEHKYSYRSTGQNVNTDVSCTDPATQAQANTYKQTDLDRQRTAGMILVETGWTYSGAGSVGTATGAPPQSTTTDHSAAPATDGRPVASNPPTPAAEAEAALARRITGVYHGTYICRRGPVNLTLTLVSVVNGSVEGVFKFHLPANSNPPTASYTLNGKYDPATRKFQLNPVKWEPPEPSGYIMVGLDGELDPKSEQVSGTITGGQGACTTFEATRDKVESAALANHLAAAPSASR